jgi:hypothetical protein
MSDHHVFKKRFYLALNRFLRPRGLGKPAEMSCGIREFELLNILRVKTHTTAWRYKSDVQDLSPDPSLNSRRSHSKFFGYVTDRYEFF